MKKSLPCLVCMLALVLVGFAPRASAWSNGGYSSDPRTPDNGTHDYLFVHALNMLPAAEKNAIVHNLSLALYGTEMPDNPNEIGDTTKHHVYYNSGGQLTDDSAAGRAQTEYNLSLSYLISGDYNNSDKHIGAMSHYIVDVAVFGHVMGASTDWGAENHHSDYESYVQNRTTSYTSSYFDGYIVYDGNLTGMSAYSATTSLAYPITFGSGAVKSCTWMDANYNWGNPTFKDSCGASMNLAANYLAEVLHKLYTDYGSAPTNNDPTLTSGSVSPSSGTIDTTFTYEVIYTDADSDAPSYVEVYIDGTPYSMTKISGTYTSGALYHFTISSLSTGPHTYYFETSDRTATARLPTSGSYSGPSVVDTAPTLTSGSVSPSSGFTSTTFTYEVAYTDADGDAPSHVRVYVDGVSRSMTKISGTYTEGTMYRYTTTLNTGSHTYYFETSDNRGATARLPMSGSYSGPVVEIPNNPPTASFSYSPSSLTTDNTAQFTDQSTDNDGTIASWSWNFGDGTTSTLQNPTHKYPSEGTYTVTLTVIDNGGAPNSTSECFAVKPSSIGPTTTFEVTITFYKPDGTALANTTIYYGNSEGQETSYLGTTDSHGRIVSTNSALSRKTIYFKSSDGRYMGSTYVSTSGGTASASLTEVSEFPWLVVIGSLIIIVVVGVYVLVWRKRWCQHREGRKVNHKPLRAVRRQSHGLPQVI